MSGRIKTLTRAAALPIIGKLKIGEKKKNASGVEYPVSLDYFKADGKYAPIFEETLGKEVKKLRVAFISDDINDVCNERFESWDNGVVRGFKYGEGDGHVFRVYNNKTKKYEECTKDDEKVRSLKWQAILTLRFVVLDLPGIMGQWQLTTRGSASSIPNIVKSFDFVKQKAGTIIGLPFDLIIEKTQGKMMFGDKIQTTNFPVINLIPNFTEDNIKAVREFISKGGNPSQVAVLTMDMEKTKLIENVTPIEVVETELNNNDISTIDENKKN